jgi:transketolase
MPFEELSLLRSIPHAHIYEASDDKCLRAILEETYHTDGLNYVRMIRKNAIEIYEEGETFEDGYKLLREGSDVSIVASGIMVADALQAADRLAAEGISATVIDLYRVKPVNEAALLKAAETGAIVTAENHNVIGGIGSVVAETLAELKPTLQYRVGVREAFGQVGQADYLKEQYGLTAENIVAQAKRLVEQKAKISVNV